MLICGGSRSRRRGLTATGPGSGQPLQVIAGENFWGSIATQLGGTHVTVTSIVTNPNTDPHEYESSATDARAFATADYVVLDGAGYDDWGQKLLSANPSSSRKVLTVADLLNKKAGDNPHFWYNPDWVDQVADRITADYQALDPAGSAYFIQQRQAHPERGRHRLGEQRPDILRARDHDHADQAQCQLDPSVVPRH